jgi:hypothetical protein
MKLFDITVTHVAYIGLAYIVRVVLVPLAVRFVIVEFVIPRAIGVF